MADPTRQFDGIVCFGGEDWWYHNRGHYDMQMMRELSGTLPVLYVNSIGMRMPRPGEGRMFLTRIGRKLASIRRGLVSVTDRMAVLSPVLVPGGAGLALTGPLLKRSVRRAMRASEIHKPLVWVACPTAAKFVDALHPAAVVYQRTDRYEAYRGVDRDRITNADQWLKARADLTVFCSTMLHERESPDCRRACYVDHGVDFDKFVSAGQGGIAEPTDMACLARPRVGFVGGIDAHTFDAELFAAVARALPEMQFVLVGACSLPRQRFDLPNVTLLGRRPYESVPAYMAACDVLIMPWNQSPWIQACNPVKLKEYLATGRPIVSTGFAELQRYDGLFRTADRADLFAEAISDAVGRPGDPRPRRQRVRGESWSSKAKLLLGELEHAGVVCWGQAGTEHEAPQPPPDPADMDCRPAGATATAPGYAARACRNELSIDLAACILLAGGLRPSPLVAATGRSVLDLSLTPTRTVLDCWADRIGEVTAALQRPTLIRVVGDANSPVPWPGTVAPNLIIEQEPRSLRGPAGVLRDLCADEPADRHVLVADAGRFATASLLDLLQDHVDHDADVTVASNADGSPAGMYIIRCGTLSLVPTVGFMDLKEQWLRRAVDASFNVRVHQMNGDGVLPLRSRSQLLRAAAAANGIAPRPADEHDGASGFGGLRVICNGSLIGPGAAVIDSIIMAGAIVGANAVVVRSLVVPNCRIDPGADIVDAVAHAGEFSADPAHGAGG